MNEEKTTEQRDLEIDYLKHSVSENLNHARHVENERLTFTSIYIAMVIGAVAVVFGLENNWIAAGVAALLTVFGIVSFHLNDRWQGVFDDHMSKAAECDHDWCKLIGRDEPCYLYGKYSPGKDHKPLEGRTRRIFRNIYGATAFVLGLLTVYLAIKAIRSPLGGGFYFTTEAVDTLEDIINRIVEVTRK